ncbi:MAG TPA: OmpH family outer membrane protein [Puia sp.]|jgi:outer membrane protein|nr:OmpH family outer membrane protein [Puia sp.]
MKQLSFCLLVLSLSLFLSTVVSAQKKIGYINLDELIAVMTETRQARQAMKVYGDSLSRVDGGFQEEFFTKRDAFFHDSAGMDAATKEAHRRVLQKIIQDEGAFKADAKAKLDSMQQVLTIAVVAKAQEAVAAAAKANGYAYVFKKATGTEDQRRDFVLIAPEGDDLLPLVKKQLGL